MENVQNQKSNEELVAIPEKYMLTIREATVLVKLFCNTLFGKYLFITSFHWC